MAAKKNTTSRKTCNLVSSPTHKTMWAAYMNGVDLYWINGSEASRLAKAFGSTLPNWLIDSEPWREITGQRFRFFRQTMAKLSIAQTATYLRVTQYEVKAWEAEKKTTPFAAFEALRLLTLGAVFRTSHKRWDGWFINRKTGELVSPDVGKLAVTPEEINGIPFLHNRLSILESQVDTHLERIAELEVENTALRSSATSRQFAAELEAMQEHIAALLTNVRTAEIIAFNPPAAESRRASC